MAKPANTVLSPASSCCSPGWSVLFPTTFYCPLGPNLSPPPPGSCMDPSAGDPQGKTGSMSHCLSLWGWDLPGWPPQWPLRTLRLVGWRTKHGLRALFPPPEVTPISQRAIKTILTEHLDLKKVKETGSGQSFPTPREGQRASTRSESFSYPSFPHLRQAPWLELCMHPHSQPHKGS